MLQQIVPPIPGPTVLLVEDDAVATEVLRAGFEHAGFRIISAPTGDGAMNILRDPAVVVDWLLADIVLPGPVDGWTVGTEFHLQRPDRPPIFFSAYEQKDLSRQPAGAIFVPKPVRPAELIVLFRELEARQLQSWGSGPHRWGEQP